MLLVVIPMCDPAVDVTTQYCYPCPPIIIIDSQQCGSKWTHNWKTSEGKADQNETPLP
jgi:hypothetical protein